MIKLKIDPDHSSVNKKIFVKPIRKPSPAPVCIINCETWRIIGPATEQDNFEAKSRIIERIRNAFWL